MSLRGIGCGSFLGRRLVVTADQLTEADVSGRNVAIRLKWCAYDVRSTISDVARPAGPTEYDGIPYGELPIEEVDWTHRADYIRTRSLRKGRPEFDVEPEWATQAALDPKGLVGDGRSESGETIRVVGRSVLAKEVLTVLLLPKEHPPAGDWWDVNAWKANNGERREYEDQGGQQ